MERLKTLLFRGWIIHVPDVFAVIARAPQHDSTHEGQRREEEEGSEEEEDTKERWPVKWKESTVKVPGVSDVRGYSVVWGPPCLFQRYMRAGEEYPSDATLSFMFHNDLRVMRLLDVMLWPEVDGVDPITGQTPLMGAALAGKVGAVQFLLDMGANRRKKSEGRSALNLAKQQQIELQQQQALGVPNLRNSIYHLKRVVQLLEYRSVFEAASEVWPGLLPL